MKSDYVWVFNGELQRFIINNLMGLFSTLAVMALTGGVDLTDLRWAIAPAMATGLAIIQFIQGKLPAVSPPKDDVVTNAPPG